MNEAVLRPERPGDYDAVARLLVAAFGGDLEARLVTALRPSVPPALSIVAEIENEVVGHILFSAVAIGDVEPRLTKQHPPQRHPPEPGALALAPMAVLPDHQNRGIGGMLVTEGLATARRLGYRIVVVVGHPRYYPRFGFRPARPRGIHYPGDVPDEAWMALELVPGALDGVTGVVSYHEAFATFA